MRLGLAIMACGTLAAAILVVTFSHRISAERRLAEEETLRRLQSTSREVDQYAARAVGEAALVLLTLRDDLPDRAAPDGLDTPQVGSLLRDQLKRAGTLSNIIIARPDGTIAQAARGDAGDFPALSEAVRQDVLSRSDGGPAILAPAQPDAAAPAVLSVSLALADASGRPAGVVIATIPVSHFETIYQAVHAEARGAMALWRSDGAKLLQFPTVEPAGWPRRAFDRVLAQSDSGTLRESTADGGAWVSAYRTVRGWPLIVSVSAGDADYLAEWRANSWWNGIGAGVGVVIILGLTALLARYVRRRDLAQAEVARSRQLLADAIDSLPDAFILFDKDDRLLAVNRRYREDFPQFTPLLEPGVTYEAILRAALERGIFHDAVGREEAWLAQRLRAHRQPGPPFELALADGRWFRVSEHATADGGIVGVRIDITARKRDERRLQQSERQAQAIMDAAVDGLVVIDETGTIRRVNRSVTAMFGYRGDDLIGRNVKMLMAEPFRSKHDLYMKRYRDTAAAHIVGKGGIEVVGQRQDGSTFPVDLVVGELMLDERRYFIGAMRDISDRVNMQAMLREAIESTSDAFVYFDADGRLILCNRKYIEAYTFLKDVPHVIGMTFEEIVRLGLKNNYLKDPLARSDPEAWLSLRLEQFRVPPEGPLLRQLADGRWLQVSDRRTPSGGLVGVRSDVTERMRTVQALRESERRFRLLVDGARDYAIVMLDPQGRVTSWNEGARQITGYDAGDILGRGHEVFWPAAPIAAGAPAAALRTAHEDGRYAAREQRVRQDGSLFWADIVISRIDSDTESMPAGFAVIMRDITERIAIEEQLAHAQKMEAVGQLTGGLAHDFNNLLQVVMTNLELVLDCRRDDDMALRAADALRAAERGAELTSQMLAFARRQTLSPRRTDLGALIAALVGLLRRTLGENIAIDLRLASPLRDVMIDRGQLESALLNLALNARDAMPHGGRLRIAADNVDFDDERAGRHAEARHGRFVAITVADTGVGMSDAVRMRAFEPFFTTKDIGKGSGLGLSMVYGFVKQSGGHIELDSVPGGGTMLTLYLPEAAPLAAAAAGPAFEPVVDGHGETVLVVEDNHDVRRLAVTLLKALGYGVIEAADGPAALGVLDMGAAVDLLLTDVMLAGDMSGPDVAHAARIRRPGLKLAYMSGYTGAARGRPALDPDVTLVAKPFTRAGFARAIRAALDGG